VSAWAHRGVVFAECGFRGTSVRAITDPAGADLAAVGYHFASKADLLTAVVRPVIEPILAVQCAGLDRLQARSPDRHRTGGGIRGTVVLRDACR
jgi:AcrR family transcriptional regulator